MMEIKAYNPAEHYETMVAWWAGRHPIIAREDIPPTGWVAYVDGRPVMAAWLILTNATFAYFKGVVSSPTSGWQEREEALALLVQAATETAQDFGFKKLISVPIKRRLAEKFQKAGFMFYPELVHMCEKEI